MDKQQLLIKLKKSGPAVYSNISGYESHLKQASEIRIDISNISNQDKMGTAYDEVIKTKVIDSKFDNVYFDVKGAQLPHSLTGVLEQHDCGVHVMPLAYETSKSTIYTILMTEFRQYGKVLLSRSYLMFADITGLHVMPQVDNPSAKAGCVCYAKNPFNNHPAYALNVKERMPCFALDVGFALPACRAVNPGCEATISHIPTAGQLIKVLLAYINLPTNQILRVDNYRNKNGKQSRIGKPYYIAVDSTQISKILNGDKSAETKGNNFIDGSKLLEAMKIEKANLSNSVFSVDNTSYTQLENSIL